MAEIRIRVNGTWRTLEVATLLELLESIGYGADQGGLAVAVNDEVVARGQWATRVLQRDDTIEIVGAVQGG